MPDFCKKVRVNCVEVIVGLDLNVTYRLTLPIKPDHIDLIEDRRLIIPIPKKKGGVRYMLVYESGNKDEVLKVMRSAQVVILSQKITEMERRKELILNTLAETI